MRFFLIFEKLFFFLLLLFVYSCTHNGSNKNRTDVVSKWVGKEIQLPENVKCYVSGKDAFTFLCRENIQKEYKILLYVDSIGFSKCSLRLFDWNQLIKEAENLFQGKLGFLFYFQPKNVKDFRNIIISEKFKHPVYLDIDGVINDLNDFRFISKGNTKSAVFTITNTGDQPLVIHRVSTSCGCTKISWEKQPVSVGKTTTLNIEITPEETGFFSKTIDVYCNTNKSPVKLLLSGIAE